MKVNKTTFSSTRKEWREIGIAIFANILTSVLLYLNSTLSWEWQLIIFLNLSLFFIGIIYFFNYRAKLHKIKNKGIQNILTEKEKPSFDDYGSITTGNFFFWGISAKRMIAEPSIRKKLIEISNAGHEIRFLLLNPNSPNIERKARDEGADYNVWKQEIKSVIDEIKHFKTRNNISIKVKVYNEFPVWRIIIMNNSHMHLTYFLTNKQGIESPMFILKKGENDTLFEPFFTEFNEVWNDNNRSIDI